MLTGVLPHSADLRFGLETLAYENAENQYPRRTVSPKIDPPGVHMPNSKGSMEAL